MKKTKVIPSKYLPVRMPLFQTAFIAFLMDYYSASDIWWGVFFAVSALIWISWAISFIKQESDEKLVNSNVTINLGKLINNVNIKKND